MRRASRTVGVQIAVASSALVLVVLIAAFAFVFAHIEPSRLFEPGRHESAIDVGGLDILVGAVVIGAAAIVLAGVVTWFATRRAVRPLGAALRLQREFIANASHELRTPLAVLDARLQYLQRRLPASDPASSTVAELRRDTGMLVQTVNELLAGVEDLPDAVAEPVDLVPAVEQAVESMRVLAAARGVEIALDAPEAVPTCVPAVSTHRCVVALIDNALRFSPRGATITVSVRADRAHAELRVRDRGSGIHGIDPSRIFERFARGSAPGTPGGPDEGRRGFGIGLALVHDTVERYGGTATVASSSDDGTEVLITLPRADAPRRRARG
ncbi:sensor histidine kinase [Lysinimonas soli]|uniref:histidine kinase n=1 Tax=Lysinimonas soli TaxID=1074233 RepID=A0ABW0NRA1_9MICO